MNIDAFRQKVNIIFSDTVMISLALLIIPIIIAQYFLTLTPSQQVLVSAIDWFIWAAFFLEFVLKLGLAKQKIKWLAGNKLDSTTSIAIIISPILEYFLPILASTLVLRLLRLTRLVALGAKVKRKWGKIDLKMYAAFFVVVGIGITASFFSTGFQYSSIDITWLSLFVSIFGVFYAVMVSFFIIHVWGKYTTIGNEISKEVNSLRNVYLFALQFKDEFTHKETSRYLLEHLNEVVDALWREEIKTATINKAFIKLINYFSQLTPNTEMESIIIGNIIEELRASSTAQANLINAAREKSPKILWILLIFLSTVLVGSFVFIGFQNQIVATVLITLVSGIIGLVVALMFDIDTPFQAGFWNISPSPYLELKEFIKRFSKREDILN